MLPDQPERSHLFTLRLWGKKGDDEHTSWRGKLHHINDDKVRYFQDWPALIPLILAMLRASNSDQSTEVEADNPSSLNEITGENLDQSLE